MFDKPTIHLHNRCTSLLEANTIFLSKFYNNNQLQVFRKGILFFSVYL